MSRDWSVRGIFEKSRLLLSFVRPLFPSLSLQRGKIRRMDDFGRAVRSHPDPRVAPAAIVSAREARLSAAVANARTSPAESSNSSVTGRRSRRAETEAVPLLCLTRARIANAATIFRRKSNPRSLLTSLRKRELARVIPIRDGGECRISPKFRRSPTTARHLPTNSDGTARVK